MNDQFEITKAGHAAMKTQCPSYLPMKFWDGSTGQPRLEQMAKSYKEMERKGGSGPHKSVPGHASEYCVECKSELFSNNEAVNARLHKAGFSQDQAQLVYDLAHEALEPLVVEIMASLHGHQQVDRLCDKFGGEDRWQETARQLRAWASNKMNSQTYEAMSSSYDGVMALYDMMSKGEPGMGGHGVPIGMTSEEDIKKLMRDPKYWRDQDASTVNRVREGFRRLYPN